MNVNHTLSRSAALVAGALLALSGSLGAAETDELPTFNENYIKVSGTIPSFNGNGAASQRRTQYSHDGAGGIEDFNYTAEVAKDVTSQVAGHLLPGAGDYLAEFKLTKNEVGSLEVGYKRFRTFYDGAGGFFPTNNAWIPLYPRANYVDRAKFVVEGTVELPNAPVFNFRYTNELRNGTKDSTIWGDSDFTGIPIYYGTGAVNPVTATRKILPAYIQLNERQQEWELSVSHTVANTTASFSLIGTQIDNLDSRTVDRYTGELRPYPFPTSTTPQLLPNQYNSNPNKGMDIQGFKESALAYLGKVETKLSDAATFYADASYRHATGSTIGSRLISASIATGTGVQNLVAGYATGQRPPYSYTNAGTLKTDTLTGVIGLRTTPAPDLQVDVALRGEQYKVTADSVANYVASQVVLATGAVTPLLVTGPNNLRINEKPWTPSIDVNYTGLPNTALYVSWDYRSLKQDELTNYTAFTVNTSTGALTGPLSASADNIKEHHTNLKLGANWSPSALFSLRPEFFTKDHENRFDGYGVSAGNYYYLNYDIYGARISAIVRPLATLKFNTRYVVQRGKADVAEQMPARPFTNDKSNSNDSRRYELSETIDWTPSKSLYMQGTAKVVYDTIVTSYPYVTGLAQTVLHNSDNNYWNGSVLAGFVIDKETDAQIQSTYYRANNYNRAFAATMMPMGVGEKESTVTLGLKRKFSDRLVGTAKIGYINSTSETTGGNTDFKGPVGYLALEYRL